MFKLSARYLPLLYAFFLVVGLFQWQFLFFLSGGVCSVVVLIEIVMASRKGRDVRWTFVRATLTACAVLTFLPFTPLLPEMFSSFEAVLGIFVYMAIVVGPSACLAAALWTGLPSLKSPEFGAPLGSLWIERK